MLAGSHALIRFWVITSSFVVHPVREANYVCIPLRMDSFIVSIYYWIFSITRAKPSYKDASGLHDLLVRRHAAREPRKYIDIVAS